MATLLLSPFGDPEGGKNTPARLKKFYKPDGSNYEVGEIFKQPDLAWTLSEIAKSGAEAFYHGSVAEKIVADMEAHNGLITMSDLSNYEVIEREPVRGTYRDYVIEAMPAPSSGGTHVIQMLNILENYNLKEFKHNSSKYINLLTEVMKHAYADRSKYLGDPDFYDVPINKLTSNLYAESIVNKIELGASSNSSSILPGMYMDYESDETTL